MCISAARVSTRDRCARHTRVREMQPLDARRQRHLTPAQHLVLAATPIPRRRREGRAGEGDTDNILSALRFFSLDTKRAHGNFIYNIYFFPPSFPLSSSPSLRPPRSFLFLLFTRQPPCRVPHDRRRANPFCSVLYSHPALSYFTVLPSQSHKWNSFLVP